MTRAAIAALCVLALAGCSSFPFSGKGESARTPITARPASGPVVESHVAKDSRVIASADRIDAATTEPAIAAETAEIRDAVASAPAINLQPLVNEFNRALDARDREIDRLREAVTAAQNKELVYQARGLTIVGFGCLAAFGLGIAFGGGVVAAMKLWPVAVIGVGCLGLAQIVAHPWFMRGVLATGTLGLAWLVYYVIDRHKAGRLRASVDRKLEVLREVVPVLDDAYDSAADSVKAFLDASIFDRLSRKFSPAHKAAVHEVRAAQQQQPTVSTTQ